MVDRRTEILSGELSFPIQIIKLLDVNDAEQILINDFWNNVWYNFLKEKSCDTITWYNKFNNPDLFNKMLLHLSKAGWITSEVDYDYACITLNTSKLLKWVTEEELTNIKYKYKFNKYRLKRTKSTLSDVVQINGKHQVTGLVREGFMKAGNNIFYYDTRFIKKYMDGIVHNLKKGLAGSTKDITYQEIIEELTDYYSVDTTEYTLGNCIIDSRGRSIFQCSKKLFNPVSSKDARAVLICPIKTHLTTDGINAVYTAISELLGYRGKNYEDKIEYGKQAYKNRTLPSYEDMVKSKDFDDLHQLIWLERIYENLDTHNVVGWNVPIEVDALASLIQLVAVLTNDHVYMDETNLIGEEFKDIWTVDYCSRKHIKKALTPKLYGSGKHPKDLWDKNKLQYTTKQLNAVSKDIAIGKYANANDFKDFIINNVKPRVKMKVQIWNEVFDIYCNRFKWEETTEVTYYIYYSNQSKLKKVIKAVNMVPDTEQFKRFFQTLLLFIMWSSINRVNCWNAKSIMLMPISSQVV